MTPTNIHIQRFLFRRQWFDCPSKHVIRLLAGSMWWLPGNMALLVNAQRGHEARQPDKWACGSRPGFISTHTAWLHTVVHICTIMLRLNSHIAPFPALKVNARGLPFQCKHNHLPISPIFFMAQLQGNTAICSNLWYYSRDDEMDRFMKVTDPDQTVWNILLYSDLNTYGSFTWGVAITLNGWIVCSIVSRRRSCLWPKLKNFQLFKHLRRRQPIITPSRRR